ncbi:SDR family NAD(P)-dependent oxidoreductase [Bacteroidota bacterium]
MNILITGASNGIGYELSKILASNSENTIIALARNREKLNNLKENCQNTYPDSSLILFPFDLENGNWNTLDGLIREIGDIDILVNNAGLMIKGDFDKLSDEDWLRLYKVNLLGPVKLIRKLLPFMGKNIKGHIVNISSMAGFQGSVKFQGTSAYAASKAALANLTEVLAAEFAENNIAVNCLALGAVQTDMLSKAFPDYAAPLNPLQMAEFIADFCLNGHRCFNGKILPVALSTP